MHRYPFLRACLALALTAPTLLRAETVDDRARALVSQMTLHEKVMQLSQRNGSGTMAEKMALVDAGVGSFLNVTDPAQVDALQREAVEHTRLGIPLLFGRDVIHGYRTVFPIPLAQACTFDPEAARAGSEVAAAEASTVGINWTFAPMMDIARDPRWGRIAEGYGEDPLLVSLMAAASVRGFQGANPVDGSHLAACAKHFAGYGASEGGRDYNTVLIPERELRDIYLPPFKACVDAGVLTFMSAFSDLDGIPATANHHLMTDILRKEWGFKGFVVSDWGSIVEMIKHGIAADASEAARLAIDAGVNMEMASPSYEQHIQELIDSHQITMEQIDALVMDVLRVKLQMGLFDHPYRVPGREGVVLSQAHKDLARKVAAESAVLLENDGTLPLAKGAHVAVIGPLADAPLDQLGTWCFDGRPEDAVTPLTALRTALGADHVTYAAGLDYSRQTDTAGFAAAVAAAKQADVALVFAGEESFLSGEAHSRADIRLPGAQEALIQQVASAGKPVVLIVMSGRPIVLTGLQAHAKTILVAFHGGTMAGPALADLLTGTVSPSGRLPVTWPLAVGQIPIYYNHKNTGRPPVADFVPLEEMPRGMRQTSVGNKSFYMDIGYKPAYPFGYGLTYSTFGYSDLQVEEARLPVGGTLHASALLTNTGNRMATEVVQLYVHDVAASVTRPVRELKGFQRVTLAPGESVRVRFALDTHTLDFHNREMQDVVEPGDFDVWIAPNAAEGLEGHFTLTAQ